MRSAGAKQVGVFAHWLQVRLVQVQNIAHTARHRKDDAKTVLVQDSFPLRLCTPSVPSSGWDYCTYGTAQQEWGNVCQSKALTHRSVYIKSWCNIQARLDYYEHMVRYHDAWGVYVMMMKSGPTCGIIMYHDGWGGSMLASWPFLELYQNPLRTIGYPTIAVHY